MLNAPGAEGNHRAEQHRKKFYGMLEALELMSLKEFRRAARQHMCSQVRKLQTI